MIVAIVICIILLWVLGHFYIRYMEEQSYKAYIKQSTEQLNTFTKTYDISLERVSETQVKLSFVSAKDGKTMYIGVRYNGFFSHSGGAVGFSQSPSGLDSLNLCLEDAIKALRMCLSQGFLKER